MSAPQTISSVPAAPEVALVYLAPILSVPTSKRAGAKWLRAMCAESAKPDRTIGNLMRDVRR